ncbi:hypothetical protein EVAR_95266_1 [Eumeta japonica]|uniref:Uncharacterized protein n=1 Tax=Eumeta variegata TaxID=151549 RepID=A0A4C1ULL8_EUMVA|nr:hypothetical protein EVAR_95266_1 [Eumeta japonica]
MAQWLNKLRSNQEKAEPNKLLRRRPGTEFNATHNLLRNLFGRLRTRRNRTNADVIMRMDMPATQRRRRVRGRARHPIGDLELRDANLLFRDRAERPRPTRFHDLSTRSKTRQRHKVRVPLL